MRIVRILLCTHGVFRPGISLDFFYKGLIDGLAADDDFHFIVIFSLPPEQVDRCTQIAIDCRQNG